MALFIPSRIQVHLLGQVANLTLHIVGLALKALWLVAILQHIQILVGSRSVRKVSCHQTDIPRVDGISVKWLNAAQTQRRIGAISFVASVQLQIIGMEVGILITVDVDEGEVVQLVIFEYPQKRSRHH